MRLAKFLSRAGVASRRSAEAIVAQGRVTVAGEVVSDPAADVSPRACVCVDGIQVALEQPAVYMLNKPRGVVSTAKDTHARQTVIDLVDSDVRLYPVGRLDRDSVGLIFLTNDGELANRLTHPRYGVEKTYRARVRFGPVSDATLAWLRAGVALDDGISTAVRAGCVSPHVLEVSIREGRKHQVRRMLAAVGHPVTSLERVAFGGLCLGALARGRSRRLTDAEVAVLWKNAGGDITRAEGGNHSR
jgi:23S rRNA pseudouridine2605 synthase